MSVFVAGLVFLQYQSETKRALLPNEITSMDTVRALFVRSFPKQLTMEYLDSPHIRVYIHDPAKDMFYELEDLRDIRDRSVLRIYEQDVNGGGVYSTYDQDLSYFGTGVRLRVSASAHSQEQGFQSPAAAVARLLRNPASAVSACQPNPDPSPQRLHEELLAHPRGPEAPGRRWDAASPKASEVVPAGPDAIGQVCALHASSHRTTFHPFPQIGTASRPLVPIGSTLPLSRRGGTSRWVRTAPRRTVHTPHITCPTTRPRAPLPAGVRLPVLPRSAGAPSPPDTPPPYEDSLYGGSVYGTRSGSVTPVIDEEAKVTGEFQIGKKSSLLLKR
ncbi:coiled-coil domain-containing protein AGAP005037 [Caerostris extrusa]|uniref:Coiled-coil domain-containing protein AGAP005037 n=1 Tax=Caerostris extrusa TaxID=172846 RepID=A0AAV4X4Y1_CAEEX|nr:coiled-coil domain-containing protein AGAP005037 [Caerostris extrusa]